MKIAAIAILLVWFTIVWGCVPNLFDMVTGYSTMATNELALRGLGVFVPPLGAFFGWF